MTERTRAVEQHHFTELEIRAYLNGSRERMACVLLEEHVIYCGDCRKRMAEIMRAHAE